MFDIMRSSSRAETGMPYASSMMRMARTLRRCTSSRNPYRMRKNVALSDFSSRRPKADATMRRKLSASNCELVMVAVTEDRKSVVSGKSVLVRVDLGGRRILKKKKRKQEQ